jgi:hypothetical protein
VGRGRQWYMYCGLQRSVGGSKVRTVGVCSQTLTDVHGCYTDVTRMFTDVTRMFTDVHGCSRMFTDVTWMLHGCSRMFTDVTRMFTDVHGCSRMFTDVHGCYTDVHGCYTDVHGSTSISTDASSSSWKFMQIDQGGYCSWMATAVIKKFTAEYGCSRIKVDHQ